MSNKLLEKIRKNSTISLTNTITNSDFISKVEFVSTEVPVLNIMLAGDIKGGLTSGLTTFAGPSKHFKSTFALLLAKSYLEKYQDSILLFYDSEFGTPKSYFNSMEIDTDRAIHTPITNIEELKHDITVQLKNIDRGDKVIIVIDSIGNLASLKEAEDAEDGKSVADMTRAKSIKSLFRIVTPHLKLKNIPLIAINHTYKEQSMYPKDIVSGGTGITYSSDNIYIIGRQQEKKGTEIEGYNFIINAEKSRFVKEKSKVSVQVTFDGGINRYSGLMEIALELGFCAKPKNGWYAKVNQETGEIEDKNYRLNDTYNEEFWNDILNNNNFQEEVKNRFRLSNDEILKNIKKVDEITNNHENIEDKRLFNNPIQND